MGSSSPAPACEARAPWCGPSSPGPPGPAVGPHQPLHRSPGHLDALTAQMGQHLQRPAQRLRPAPAVDVGLVIAGQNFGDGGIPQGPPRPGPRGPGVERSLGDLAALRGNTRQIGATPKPSAVLCDDLADHRCRRSLSRTKKLVGALRISMVSSSSAFFLQLSDLTRRSGRGSLHPTGVTPRPDAATCAASPGSSPTGPRPPSSPHTHWSSHPRARRPDGPPWGVVLLRHGCHLPNQEDVHQTGMVQTTLKAVYRQLMPAEVSRERSRLLDDVPGGATTPAWTAP